MTCEITGGKPRVIKHATWRKDDKPKKTSGLYTLSDNGRVMTINPLSHRWHDAHYSCAAENAVGMGSYGTSFHLQVNCKCAPILSEMSMKVTLTDLALYVMPTVFVLFTC